jgi:hypothetical protein
LHSRGSLYCITAISSYIGRLLGCPYFFLEIKANEQCFTQKKFNSGLLLIAQIELICEMNSNPTHQWIASSLSIATVTMPVEEEK